MFAFFFYYCHLVPCDYCVQIRKLTVGVGVGGEVVASISLCHYVKNNLMSGVEQLVGYSRIKIFNSWADHAKILCTIINSREVCTVSLYQKNNEHILTAMTGSLVPRPFYMHRRREISAEGGAAFSNKGSL